MGPLELALQSSEVSTRIEGLFTDAPEGETPRQILLNVFYGVTDALLNITLVNGHPVVDISRQQTRSERWKSYAGQFALSTVDWLRQVSHNLYGANKPGLLGGSMTGMASVMGVPMLHRTDSFNNPLHAVVVDVPGQEGLGICQEAINDAQTLCSIGVEAGTVGNCADGQRFQLNTSGDGNFTYSPLSPAGALEAAPVTISCAQINDAQGQIAQPTEIPFVQPTQPSQEQPVIVATISGSVDVTCVGEPLIGTASTAAVIAGFQQACYVTISEAMANFFLDTTGTRGTDTLYGEVNGETLAAWTEQQWPRYMIGDQLNEASATPTNPVQEATPISPSEICNLTDPGQEDRIRLDTSSSEIFQNELLAKCGLTLTPEQLDFFARALGFEIWVHGTTADVRLRFIKEMAEALQIPVMGTPVAFEGPPPTPVLATPVAGGEEVGAEDEEVFWDLNILDKLFELTGLTGLKEDKFQIIFVTGLIGLIALLANISRKIREK